MTFVSNSHPSDRQQHHLIHSHQIWSHTHTLGFFLVQNTIKVCQAKWVVVFYQKHLKLAPHHFAYIWWPWCVVNLIAVGLVAFSMAAEKNLKSVRKDWGWEIHGHNNNGQSTTYESFYHFHFCCPHFFIIVIMILVYY